MQNIIKPNWPAPVRVKAYSTTRNGGVSQAPFNSFNLAYACGDDHEAVRRNRELLAKEIKLPQEPLWLHQVHQTTVVAADEQPSGVIADGAYTSQPQIVCTVLTADCLPVLICDRAATCVAAVHAGWKGLAAGVIESALAKLSVAPQELLVWFGPAIGPTVYEVGEEVLAAFIAHDQQALQAFEKNNNGRWLMNLYGLATLRLQQCGVTQIFGGDFCTYTDKEHFFSYRRDQQTGRMASLIWIDKW